MGTPEGLANEKKRLAATKVLIERARERLKILKLIWDGTQDANNKAHSDETKLVDLYAEGNKHKKELKGLIDDLNRRVKEAGKTEQQLFMMRAVARGAEKKELDFIRRSFDEIHKRSKGAKASITDTVKDIGKGLAGGLDSIGKFFRDAQKAAKDAAKDAKEVFKQPIRILTPAALERGTAAAFSAETQARQGGLARERNSTLKDMSRKLTKIETNTRSGTNLVVATGP